MSDLSSQCLWSLAPIELVARLTARLAAAANLSGPSTYDALFLAHDVAVSMMPWPSHTTSVFAYEDAARATFAKATRRGLEKIWHLPIPHHAALEEMWIQEAARWPGAMGDRPPIEPGWKKARKDAEFGMADCISVPSEYTAESVRRAGARVPIVVTPYGFPVGAFPPKDTYSEGPFTVISVGTHDLRKGTPYLLEAWKRADMQDARLRLVGPIRLNKAFVDRYATLFEHRPHVPRCFLPAEYRAADALLLPTLADGCPLVVQEAMCSGTPVITTRCGSGPDFITSGVDGWVIPERDIDALVDHLRLVAANRDRTLQAGRAARKRAEQWTWIEAGRELVASFENPATPGAQTA